MKKYKPVLNEHVRRLVKAQNLKALAKSSGLPRTWLIQYAAGAIKSPSCDRIEMLYHALTGHSIEVA